MNRRKSRIPWNRSGTLFAYVFCALFDVWYPFEFVIERIPFKCAGTHDLLIVNTFINFLRVENPFELVGRASGFFPRLFRVALGIDATGNQNKWPNQDFFYKKVDKNPDKVEQCIKGVKYHKQRTLLRIHWTVKQIKVVGAVGRHGLGVEYFAAIIRSLQYDTVVHSLPGYRILKAYYTSKHTFNMEGTQTY